jgi:phosphoribosylformylglycinamidine (FGAM) synthase PurS component
VRIGIEFWSKIMIDPASIAASAIAKLAFDEFVKAGAGAAAKETVAGAIELIKSLRDRIKAKFQGNERAMAALAEVERDGSEAALKKVGKYLDFEMDEEQEFAEEVRQMAHQIINIQNQSTTQIEQQNINQGRDQFVINQPGTIERLGGS